jgi:hypothetical protein
MSSIDAGFTQQPDGRWLTTKDPDDALFYGRDLEARFSGRTISTVTVADSSGVTAGTPSASGLVASVLVSGGTIGQTGSVTLRCTLDDGQITDLTLWFQIVAK